jgi:acetate kinase
MTLLTVNVGSSSVRLVAYDDRGDAIAYERFEAPSGAAELLKGFVRTNLKADVSAVGHRIVHGGPRLTIACRSGSYR